MRKALSFVLVMAVAALGMPSAAFAASKHPAHAQNTLQTGSINGVAQNAAKQPLSKYTVRVRNAQGQLAGTTTSTSAGNFSFASLPPGSYTVEIVDAAGNIVGTSTPVAVTAGSTISVNVTAAAAGALSGATGGGLSLFGLGPIASVAVITAGALATFVGIKAARNNASGAS